MANKRNIILGILGILLIGLVIALVSIISIGIRGTRIGGAQARSVKLDSVTARHGLALDLDLDKHLLPLTNLANLGLRTENQLELPVNPGAERLLASGLELDRQLVDLDLPGLSNSSLLQNSL